MNFLSKNRHRIILAAALLLFGVRLGLGGFFASASDINAQSIADGVNKERSERNLNTLNYNSELAAAAQYKASDMIARNYFAHVDPDGNYIWPKIVSEGYTPYTTLGENLAVDFPDTQSLMSAWIDSPEHRANILNTAFQDQGAGVASGNGNGQFQDAMANTFGALATKPAAKTTPPAAPVVSKPAPQPAAVAHPTPTTPVAVAPSTTKPTPPVKTITPPPASTITSAPPQTAAPTMQAALSDASIDTSTVVITPSIKNNILNLHVVFDVNGTASSVSGSVLGVNTQFTNSGNNIYSGDLSLEQYTNYGQQNLTFTVLDKSNHESDTVIPLKNYPLPLGQDPTSVTSLLNQIQHPDLYNVYRYIVALFGVLFLGMMIADTVLFRRTKGLALSIKRMGDWNLPMILLIAGTLMTVWWWH